MLIIFENLYVIDCRSPHGERGLKYQQQVQHLCNQRRSPHGERGLKFTGRIKMKKWLLSLSSRRAWIEIVDIEFDRKGKIVALLTESVDWNELAVIIGLWIAKSLSSRRAWIEIIEQ